MGRIARGQVFYDGCSAHIFTRSIEKKHVFCDEQDFITFKKLLSEIKGKHGFLIRHYCLMNTHFHMAVTLSTVVEFSKGLQKLKQAYTKWFNARYKRVGPLWRERFKGLLIEDERYLCVCGQYIEENPVKANLVKRVEDWPHSSGAHYKIGNRDELVDANLFPQNKIQIYDDGIFTKGTVIGSKIFKVQKQEERFIKSCLSPKR